MTENLHKKLMEKMVKIGQKKEKERILRLIKCEIIIQNKNLENDKLPDMNKANLSGIIIGLRTLKNKINENENTRN